MTTPDEQEQRLPAAGDVATSVAADLPLEADDADVLEQATDAGPAEAVAPASPEHDLPLEASEGDVVEQRWDVPLDEEERPA